MIYFSSVGGRQTKKAQLFEVGMRVLLSVSSSSPGLALLSWLPRCTGSASGFSREGKGPDFGAASSVCQSQPGPQSPGQHRGSPRLPVLREGLGASCTSWGLHQEVWDHPWVPPKAPRPHGMPPPSLNVPHFHLCPRLALPALLHLSSLNPV